MRLCRHMFTGIVPALLLGCYSAKPGPIPTEEAQAPVRVVGQAVQGPVTWITLAVRAGSAHDPVGKEGLAALTARMLREGGAGDRTPEAVDELLYRWRHAQVDAKLSSKALHADGSAAPTVEPLPDDRADPGKNGAQGSAANSEERKRQHPSRQRFARACICHRRD